MGGRGGVFEGVEEERDGVGDVVGDEIMGGWDVVVEGVRDDVGEGL